jgi:hypothetical protein
VTAPRPTAWAINRILALLFVLGPPEGAHDVLLLDRAGWHTTSKLVVPENITPIFLPSRAPELNPVENIWQYLRQNLAREHRLRELRRHRRRGPRRRGEISSPTPNGSHPLNAKMGKHRSALMTVGIRLREQTTASVATAGVRLAGGRCLHQPTMKLHRQIDAARDDGRGRPGPCTHR